MPTFDAYDAGHVTLVVNDSNDNWVVKARKNSAINGSPPPKVYHILKDYLSIVVKKEEHLHEDLVHRLGFCMGGPLVEPGVYVVESHYSEVQRQAGRYECSRNYFEIMDNLTLDLFHTEDIATCSTPCELQPVDDRFPERRNRAGEVAGYFAWIGNSELKEKHEEIYHIRVRAVQCAMKKGSGLNVYEQDWLDRLLNSEDASKIMDLAKMLNGRSTFHDILPDK